MSVLCVVGLDEGYSVEEVEALDMVDLSRGHDTEEDGIFSCHNMNCDLCAFSLSFITSFLIASQGRLSDVLVLRTLRLVK